MLLIYNPVMPVQHPTADFCIEIDFQRGSDSPSRVFRAMSALIDTFQSIDRQLVQSVDVKIEPVLILEDIEAGSLRAWLRNTLQAIDDEALKKMDWKPAVGRYLVRAKYILIDFTRSNTTISDRKQLIELGKQLFSAAQETEARLIPAYAPVPQIEIAKSLKLLKEATSALSRNDSAKYITPADEVSFNLQFDFSPEAIEELLTRETISNEQAMILKVKKPDYLGDSMWDFRFENRTIQAKILDSNWVNRFQNREVEVRPGDAIKAKINVSVRYGYDGEVVSSHYTILEVLHIIPGQPEEQSGLFLP